MPPNITIEAFRKLQDRVERLERDLESMKQRLPPSERTDFATQQAIDRAAGEEGVGL